MKLVSKLLGAFLANAVGLYLTSLFVPSFKIVGGVTLENLPALLPMVATLTVLNVFVKPILKLLMGPLILFTLGFGLIVVNAVILKILDSLSGALMIETIPALIAGTLIVSTTNIVFHLFTK